MIDELKAAIEEREFVEKLTADSFTTIKDCFLVYFFDKTTVRLKHPCGLVASSGEENWFIAIENVYFTDINTLVPIGSAVRMVVSRKQKGIRLDKIFKPTDRV